MELEEEDWKQNKRQGGRGCNGTNVGCMLGVCQSGVICKLKDWPLRLT